MAFRTQKPFFRSKKAHFGQGFLENFHVFEIKRRLFILPPRPALGKHLININRGMDFFAESKLAFSTKHYFCRK